MKKLFAFILLVLVSLFSVGCTEKEDPYLLVPEGIPLIAIGGVVDKFNVTTTPGPQVLQSELLQSNYECIIAPVTLGAQLSIKSAINYKIAGLITFDNMYIIARKNTKLESVSDLEGKTIYAYGANQPGDIMLKYVLEKSSVTSTIEYADSVASVVSAYFMPENAEYALVAEPYLSKVQEKLEVNVLDLAKVLNNLGEDSLNFLPQAAVYVYKDNSKAVNKKILKTIEDNIKSLNNDNSAYANLLLEQDTSLYPLFTNLGVNVLKGVCANAGINYLKAADKRNDLEAFFKVINKSNPNLFNNSLPGDDFYYNY